ncbi:MAG: aminotransferase class V-fold PLP-dependent enzyme [Planctomycetota bacterium]|nr:aminotransferase class V-fold PLP-dependent enzyme [Planctomycetota bacterium]
MEPLLYLDHAATRWPKADGVADALAAAARELIGNSGRSAFHSSGGTIERCRAGLATLINEPTSDRVVLTSGCTDALNTAIFGVLSHRRDVPHVVSTVLEHNAVRRPLRYLASRGIITLTEVGCDAEGFVSPEAVAAAMKANTALLAITHASNVVGTIQDVAACAAQARRIAPEVLMLVDAAQTAGVVAIDVQTLGADLVAFGTHKGIGAAPGLGVLWVGPRAFGRDPTHAALQPIRFGGTGEGAIDLEGNADDDDMPPALPRRFEVGTANAVVAAGVCAALNALALQRDVLAHERALIGELDTALRAMPRVRVLGPLAKDRSVGVLSLVCEGISAHELGSILHASFNIVSRAGLHCAPAAHATLGTRPDGTLRLSVGPRTTHGDIACVIDALRQICGSR